MKRTGSHLHLILFCATTAAAGAACYKAAPPTNCCSTIAAFDPVGNCSPWAHSCPDVAISNPGIRQVYEVGANLGGKHDTTSTALVCQYQPVKCQFIGCQNSGPIAMAGCFDTIPSGAACPEGIPE